MGFFAEVLEEQPADAGLIWRFPCLEKYILAFINVE